MLGLDLPISRLFLNELLHESLSFGVLEVDDLDT